MDLDALSRLLISFNLGLSFLTKTPELNLTEDEIKLCTESYANLARFYPAIGMPEKTAAWLDFLSTFGGIYGTKIFAAKARKKEEAKNKAPVVNAAPPRPASGPIQVAPKEVSPIAGNPKPPPPRSPGESMPIDDIGGGVFERD